MADIAKCTGKDGTAVCQVAKDCYRFTAPTSDVQSYIEPVDFHVSDGCELYWPNGDRNPRVSK